MRVIMHDPTISKHGFDNLSGVHTIDLKDCHLNTVRLVFESYARYRAFTDALE
jgi:hypothetical protein